MRTIQRKSLCSLALAAVISVAGLDAQTPLSPAASPDGTVQMPTYEVSSPKFSSVLKEFYEKVDSFGGSDWVDAQGGALIQAIVWRHGYLRTHPADEAVIFVNRLSDGRVAAATTVYTEDGKLYANSFALGEHVRMGTLTAADISDAAKVEQWLGSITGQYDLGGSVLYAFGRTGGRRFRGERGAGPGYSGGELGFNADAGSTEWGPGGPLQFSPVVNNPAAARIPGYPNTGQIVPSNANMFYGAGSPFGLNALVRAEQDDRFHEPESLMLDSIYRTLHDPAESGLVPVALNPGGSALVFDWEGMHYVYRPYAGTVGYPIPSNPVTGLPYLCVKDSGLLESIYFSATYLKRHPGERAVLVPSENPSAAYTANGRLVLFSPSLNHFALLEKEHASEIGDPQALVSSVAKVKATLASLPATPARPAHPALGHVPEALPGDTADSQMRRIYLAFQAAGIPVYLKSGDAPSLTFTWQGVSYLYGPDQQLRTVASS
jgi:hypothetical protein